MFSYKHASVSIIISLYDIPVSEMQKGNFAVNRRTYLSSLGGMAASSVLATAPVAANGSTKIIGDFEGKYDGW